MDICEDLYFYVSQKNGTLGRQSFQYFSVIFRIVCILCIFESSTNTRDLRSSNNFDERYAPSTKIQLQSRFRVRINTHSSYCIQIIQMPTYSNANDTWHIDRTDKERHETFPKIITIQYHFFNSVSRVRGQETAELKVVVSKTKLRAWLRIPMLHISPPRGPHFSHVGITCTRMVTDFT